MRQASREWKTFAKGKVRRRPVIYNRVDNGYSIPASQCISLSVSNAYIINFSLTIAIMREIDISDIN